MKLSKLEYSPKVPLISLLSWWAGGLSFKLLLGTACLLPPPCTFHLSRRWASCGLAPEEPRAWCGLPIRSLEHAGDLPPSLLAGLPWLGIQAVDSPPVVLAGKQLEDLLFAVKSFQRLPFLICIVCMHLFLFAFIFGETIKGRVEMRKKWCLLRAVTLATTKRPKCCCLANSSGLNHGTSEGIRC